MSEMLLADLGSSFHSFFDAAREFFSHLADIDWPPFGIALVLLALMQLCRARAWTNVLRASFPTTKVPYRRVAAATLAGAGINGIVPARAGDATKVFLVKRQIPGASYPAVTSSFLVQSVFDTSVGILVFLYALTQGLLPRPPELPRLSAFDISFWAENTQLLIFTITVLGVGFLVGFALLARRVEEFWRSVKQGLTILSTPKRFLQGVIAWQAAGWFARFAAFFFFLEAFGIGGSVPTVMLVMSVQAISNIVPFTPGGAGAQQALLVATLEGPSRSAVLSYSVGTQIAMAAWSVLIGFIALAVVFRTTNWRGLIREAEADAPKEKDPKADKTNRGKASAPA